MINDIDPFVILQAQVPQPRTSSTDAALLARILAIDPQRDTVGDPDQHAVDGPDQASIDQTT